MWLTFIKDGVYWHGPELSLKGEEGLARLECQSESSLEPRKIRKDSITVCILYQHRRWCNQHRRLYIAECQQRTDAKCHLRQIFGGWEIHTYWEPMLHTCSYVSAGLILHLILWHVDAVTVTLQVRELRLRAGKQPPSWLRGSSTLALPTLSLRASFFT